MFRCQYFFVLVQSLSWVFRANHVPTEFLSCYKERHRQGLFYNWAVDLLAWQVPKLETLLEQNFVEWLSFMWSHLKVLDLVNWRHNQAQGWTADWSQNVFVDRTLKFAFHFLVTSEVNHPVSDDSCETDKAEVIDYSSEALHRQKLFPCISQSLKIWARLRLWHIDVSLELVHAFYWLKFYNR